jgi:hypothetical protein
MGIEYSWVNEFLTLKSFMIGLCGMVVGGGCVFLFKMYQSEKGMSQADYQESGEAKIEARIEYDKDSGSTFYIIQNVGTGTGHDVRVYLPRCYELASSRPGPKSSEIAAAITKVMMKRFDRMTQGELVEIPLLRVPPTDECRKNVYGLGLDVELRWSNARGDVTKQDLVLPVHSRNTRIRQFRTKAHAA